MSLAAVGNAQHFNIPGGGGGPPASALALEFRYRSHLYSLLLFLLSNLGVGK